MDQTIQGPRTDLIERNNADAVAETLARKLEIAIEALTRIGAGTQEGSPHGAAQDVLRKLGRPLPRAESVRRLLEAIERVSEVINLAREQIRRI